jgi:hypothetical protein
MNDAEIRHQVEEYYQGRAGFMIHLLVYILVNAGLGAVWALAQGSIASVWLLIVMLAWGSGLLAHALDWLAKSPQRLARLNRLAEERMAQVYGPHWTTEDHSSDLQRIRAATWQQFNHNKELAIHAAVFACINLAVWLLWSAAQGTINPLLPLALTLLWGAGFAAHAAHNYFDSSRAVVARERAVQRAMAQVAGDAPPEKRKREKLKHILTDDGELLEVIEDEGEEIHDVL